MIYKLRFDRSKFLTFEIKQEELVNKLGNQYLFLLDTPVWSEFWKELNVSFIDFSDKKNITDIPDITCWFTDQLVLNHKSYRCLKDKLNGYGEFLPVKSGDHPYWILHVTKNIEPDAINQESSERNIEEGGYIDVKKLTFNEDRIANNLIFKTDYTGFKNIYCTGNFKTLVEESGLTGLVFDTDLASVL